jgi:hypothetical protein
MITLLYSLFYGFFLADLGLLTGAGGIVGIGNVTIGITDFGDALSSILIA